MPRPAIIRISVATIGWIRTYATRTPFHRPHSDGDDQRHHDDDRHRREAVRRVADDRADVPRRLTPTIRGSIRMHATEAEIAMTAPTDRSTPPVAMTSVIPSASSDGRRAVAQDVDQAAVQVAVLISRLKKPGTKSRSNSRITSQQRRSGSRQPAAAGAGSTRVARARGAHALAPAIACMISCSSTSPANSADLAAVPEHDDPVARAQRPPPAPRR